MDVITLLSGISAKIEIVQGLDDDIASLRESLTPGAVRYDKEPVPGDRDEYRTESVLDDIARLEERRNRIAKMLETDKETAYRILDELKDMDSTEERLLRLYYLSPPDRHVTWFDVADQLDLDERWVYRLRKRALNDAEEIFRKFASASQSEI